MSSDFSNQALKNNKDYLLRKEWEFFPLKIRDLDIPSYIIPIRENWAGQLFDDVVASEDLFGASPEKLWSFENVYYRHTKPIKEEAPARILWYVSGHDQLSSHSKSIVGCSYLTDVQTGKPKDLFRRYKHYGIYTWNDIFELCNGDVDNEIRVLKFRHTELFLKPVSFNEVQKILRCNGYKQNTFSSPLKINNQIFFEIYEKGRV